MFSVSQKRSIAERVQKILQDTNHPELPLGEIVFDLHVRGAEIESYSDIRNNGWTTSSSVRSPTVVTFNK